MKQNTESSQLFALAVRIICVVTAGFMPLVLFGEAGEQFHFAKGLFVKHDYQSALEEYRKYLKNHPDGEYRTQALYHLAESLYRTGQYQKGVEKYTEALKKYPDAEQVPLAKYNLARAYLELDKREKALATFREAMEKADGQVRQQSIIGAAELLVDMKRFEKAQSLYETFLQDFPDSKNKPEILFSLGWLQSRRQNREAAVDTFQQLLRNYPDFPAVSNVRLALSENLTAIGEYEKAAKTLNKIDDSELNKKIRLRKAWNQFKSGAKEKAAKNFLKYAEEYKDDAGVDSSLFNAGVAYFEAKKYGEAEKIFKRLTQRKLSPEEDAEAVYWLGFALYNQGKYEKTINTFRKLYKNPDNLPARKLDGLIFTYAQALKKVGNQTKALQAYNRLLEECPVSKYAKNALYQAATSLEEQQALNKAVEKLQRLLERNIPTSFQNKTAFTLGEYLYRMDKPKKALPHLEQVYEARKSPSPELLYRLAWTHYDTDEIETAQKFFEKLYKRTSPYKAEAAYMVGRCLQKNGKPEQAKQRYRTLAQKEQPAEYVEKALYRLAYLQQGKKAAETVDEYRNRFPNGAHVTQLLLKIADHFLDSDQNKKAAERYRTLLKKEIPAADKGTAHFGLGWAEMKQDNLENAAGHFKKALDLKLPARKQSSALLQLGEIAYKQEKNEKALSYFEKVAKKKDENRARSIYMRGWCFKKLGKPKKARKAFRKLRKEYPETELAPDSAVQLAESLMNTNNGKQALKLLKKALSENPPKEDKRKLLQLYTKTLTQQEKWEKVLEQCEKFNTAYPDAENRHVILLQKGHAQKALGMTEKAKESFQKTIDATDTIEAAKARFNLANILLHEESKHLEAAKNFVRVTVLYNYPEVAPKSLYHAIKSFKKAEAMDRASKYLKELQKKYPDSKWTKKSRKLLP